MPMPTVGHIQGNVLQRGRVGVGGRGVAQINLLPGLLLLHIPEDGRWPDGRGMVHLDRMGGILGLEDGVALVVHREELSQALEAWESGAGVGRCSWKGWCQACQTHGVLRRDTTRILPTRASAADLTPYVETARKKIKNMRCSTQHAGIGQHSASISSSLPVRTDHGQNSQRKAEDVEQRQNGKHLKRNGGRRVTFFQESADALSSGGPTGVCVHLLWRQLLLGKGLHKKGGDARQRRQHGHQGYGNALHKGGQAKRPALLLANVKDAATKRNLPRVRLDKLSKGSEGGKGGE